MKIKYFMILGITLIILFMGVVGATDLDYVAADENSVVLNSVDCADISDSVDNAFIDDAGNHIANDDCPKSANYKSDAEYNAASLDDSQVLESNKHFDGNSFSALQSEINNSNINDTIILDNDVFQDGLSSISIVKSLTIDGNGHEIDAQGKSGIFRVQSFVTLKNIIFKNGVNRAIYSSSNIHIINCTFINNHNVGLSGGAIFLERDEGTIEFCNFTNNTAGGSGGAIFIQGVSANNSKNLAVASCTFDFNSAERGGAIYSDCINFTIENCTFRNNSAKEKGGAIYNNYICTVSDCILLNNTAREMGGAIYNFYNISLISDVFENNSAMYGGAIYSWDDCIISSSRFDANSATSFGGAIYSQRNSILFENAFNSNTASCGGAVYSSDYCNFSFCNFTANSASSGGALYLFESSANINGCEFHNNSAVDGGALYWIGVSGIIGDASKFMGNNASNNGGALFLRSFSKISLNFVSFLENNASYGGSLYCIDSDADFDSCFFMNNTAIDGGALHCINSTIIIDFSFFDGNIAYSDAGALYLNDSKGIIRNSYFDFNVAGNKGGAIYSILTNSSAGCNISDSQFLNNKAKSQYLKVNVYQGSLLLEFVGWNNCINAIYADSFINLKNVMYWNGELANSDYVSSLNTSSGQNIVLEIYDSKKKLVVNTTLVTNVFGEQIFNLFNLDDGNYSYKAYHLDNSYYTYVGDAGNFSLNRSSSSVSLNISDNAEFYYNECIIPLKIENRTYVSFIVTNVDESIVYLSGTLDQYAQRIIVGLGANEGYYKITVYNSPNGLYSGSQDSKLFKILKANSSVSINPINDIVYGNNLSIQFAVANKNYLNVTVYNESNDIVYTVITKNNAVSIYSLPVGKYNVTVVNLENENIAESCNFTTFNVLKADNHVSLFIDNFTYGDKGFAVVSADINGIYVLNISDSLINITVVDNMARVPLYLPAGEYFASLIFDDLNCNNFMSGTEFSVYKADNHVNLTADNVTYGSTVNIVINADVDGLYLLNVSGNLANVSVEGGIGRLGLSLPAGQYNANAILNVENYNSIINGVEFNVFKEENSFFLDVNNVSYGDKSIINISALVDGVYLLDICGEQWNVSVSDGFGSIDLSLPAGEYYVNVTFDNPNYISFIANATFSVLKADNPVNIIAVDAIYGNDVIMAVYAEADGIYPLDINGELWNVSVSDGFGTISLSLPVGHYYVDLIFDDNPNYNNAIANTSFTVFEKYNIVNVSANNVSYDKDVIICISALVDGVYLLDINGDLWNVTVSDGFGNISLSLPIGYYYTKVTFDNSSCYNLISNVAFGVYPLSSNGGQNESELPSQNITYNPNVDIDYENLSLVPLKSIYGWANSIEYQVKLMDDKGVHVSDVELLFLVNGKTIRAYTNFEGIAVVRFGLNIGTHAIEIRSNYGTFYENIRVVSRFRNNKNINMYYFDGSKYSFKVYGNNGKLVGANQVVTVKINKKTYKVKTNKNGVASFTIPKTVKPGKYTITASYKGQTIKNTITVKKILSPNKLVKVKRTASKLVLVAKLKKKLKGKKIVFRFNGKNYSAKTNKNGVAKVVIKKTVIKKLKKGKTYKAKMTYYKTSIITKVRVI